MKRDYVKPKKYIINKIKPFFSWKLCELCVKEFRRENGFEILIPIANFDFNFDFKPHYICSDCAPNKEDANKFADKLMTRPKLPQPRFEPPPKQ